MTQLQITIILTLLASVSVEIGMGVFCLLTPERLRSYEHALRHRTSGAVLMFLALGWAIPQIRFVAWDFLGPYLWGLAVGATILCWLYLDNLVPRALGGLMILGAYYYLHESFAFRFDSGVAGAIFAWLWGIAGIVISARPSLLRDFLRLGARRKRVKIAAIVFLQLSVFLLLADGILLALRRG